MSIEVNVVFPDTAFQNLITDVNTNTLVDDLIQTSANEWNVDVGKIDLSYEGNILPLGSRVSSHGVKCNDELIAVAKDKIVFSKNDLEREHSMLWTFFHTHPERYCHLDSTTFTRLSSLEVDSTSLPTTVACVAFVYGDKVEEISSEVLLMCKLEMVTFSGFNNVKRIGNGFCIYSNYLTHVNLSAFTNVEKIGNSFLASCRCLNALDFSGLGKLESIGCDFLSGCTGLKEIDLSPLVSLKSIADGFLFDCTSLTRLPNLYLPKLTTIGDSFLGVCEQLTTIDLNGLPSVTSVGKYLFYKGNPNLVGDYAKQFRKLTSLNQRKNVMNL